MINWDLELKKRRMHNIKDVKRLLIQNDKSLLEKIYKDANRYDLDVDFIKDKIINEDIFALIRYAKDPNKQNIHEDILLEYFHNQLYNVTIHKLPKTGKNAKFINSFGNILNLSDREYNEITNKSIDFEFIKDDIIFYFTFKYTNEKGGAQDNQRNDVMIFIENANKNQDDKVKFLVILDGNYYVDQINKIKECINSEKTFVLNSSQIYDFFEFKTYQKVK
ncbi:hypothetical protein [Mycoplasma sp. 4423]